MRQCSAKPKAKQKKKRSKKKNSMLNAASLDSEASQPVEARPSSDPLPATVAPIPEPGQPVHQSSTSSTPVTAAPMAAGDKGAITAGSAAPTTILTDTTAADSPHAQPTQQLDSKLDCAQSQQAQLKRVAEPMPLHRQGQHSLEPLQRPEQSPANIDSGTDWGQANGHGAEPSPAAPTQQAGVLDKRPASQMKMMQPSWLTCRALPLPWAVTGRLDAYFPRLVP